MDGFAAISQAFGRRLFFGRAWLASYILKSGLFLDPGVMISSPSGSPRRRYEGADGAGQSDRCRPTTLRAPSPVLVDRVALVQATLLEVRPHSLKYWLTGSCATTLRTPDRVLGALCRDAPGSVCVVDRLQDRSRKGVFQIFKRKALKVEHSDVNNMLDGLLNSGAAQERLSEFRQKYPESIVDVIAAISQSPTAIEVLGSSHAAVARREHEDILFDSDARHCLYLR